MIKLIIGFIVFALVLEIEPIKKYIKKKLNEKK